jgi:hypothetical protein
MASQLGSIPASLVSAMTDTLLTIFEHSALSHQLNSVIPAGSMPISCTTTDCRIEAYRPSWSWRDCQNCR